MIIGIFTTLGSAISSAVSSIGPIVSTFCTSILPRILPVLGEVIGTVKTIANSVLTVLGVFKAGEDVEQMGERALQAAQHGIKPEGFETFDEYMTEIRNFKLDPEQSANRSSVEKVSAGLAIGAAGLEKRFDAPTGSMSVLWLLLASNPTYFGAARLIDIVQGGGDVQSIARFFAGTLGPSDTLNTRAFLMDLERRRAPEKSDETLFSELNSAREAAMKFGNAS
jgi:hypothetical protein